MFTYEFLNCSVLFNPDNDWLRTSYPSGAYVDAMPNETEEYYIMARKTGYGKDIGALCREHELGHTFLCEKLGYPHSITLWDVAHKTPLEYGSMQMRVHWAEEDLVLGFQNYLNTGKVTRSLVTHQEGGAPIQDWANEFIKRFR